MIMMQGNDRIFDKVVIEGGTAAARTISLYGVKALSDLQGTSLIVRANMGGSSSATTMKVNDLAATKLSVFKNGGIADADANWIVSGQLYMLYYDGVQFIAFPMSASSGSSSSSVEFADFPIEVLNLTTQSSETDISSAFGGAAKTAEFDALVQAGTKIIRFTNVDSFVYYTAIYYKHINAESSTINDIVVVLHNYTDRTDLEMFTFLGTMTEDGDFEKYTAVVKETLCSSSQEGTLNNPRAFTGDANTKTTPGVYAITPFSNVPKNIPSGVSYGTMIVTTDEDASTITQTLQTSNTVYFRCKYSTNNWGEWVDLGASGGGSSSEGMKTFEITYDDLEDILNAESESAILAIWNDTEQGEFVEAMNDPNTVIVIKYTDDQYITDRQYVVYKTGFYNGIGYSVAQTQYISLITMTGSYLYNYKFNFNFDTEHISSVTRSSIDLSKIEDEMIVETDQATSLSFDNQTGNRGILAVSGNQEQKTSEQGKNYFTGNKIASGTEKGVTYSFDNSIFKMNGTTTSSGNIILDAPTGVRLPAGTYTWTIKVSSGNYQRPAETDFAFYLRSANDYITGELGSSGITLSSINNNIYSINFTITEEAEIYLRIFANAANIVFNNLELEIQIESGSEYTEFEQFIPNMPSPDYPSEVVCLGSNKNLLHMQEKSYTQLGVNVTQKESCLKLDGTTNGAQNILSGGYVDIGNFKKGKYSFKAHISGSFERQGKNDFAFYIRKKDDTSKTYGSIGGATIENSRNSFTFELTEDTDLVIQIWANASGIIFNNFEMKLKVEEGTEATSYSPYGQGSTGIKVLQYEKEYVNKTLPIQQEMLEGDYFVKESDGWKELHNWNKLILNGTETIEKVGTSVSGKYRFAITVSDIQKGNFADTEIVDNLISNELTVASNKITWNCTEDNVMHIRINNIPQIIIYIEKCSQMTVDEFKAFLQELYDEGKAIEIYYKLATPTKLPCTEEQSVVLDELNSLTMEFGKNNVITLENIALLQMTLVDSYLNNVIEASIPIVNSDYGNKYRYMKPYLLSYYDFNSLDSDSTQTDIENAFGSLEDEQEFIAAMNDENTNIILYYDHESNEREYWYTISKMVDSGKYHRLVLCRGNSSENMTAGSISFIIYTFSYDKTNNVYTAFNKEQIDVSSDGSGGRKH